MNRKQMESRQENIEKAVLFLYKNNLNIELVLGLPNEEKEKIFMEIEYASNNILPIKTLRSLQELRDPLNKNHTWLQNELTLENLRPVTHEFHCKVEDLCNNKNNAMVTQTRIVNPRYVSERILELILELEKSKYIKGNAKGNGLIEYYPNEQFVKIGSKDSDMFIKLVTMSNIQEVNVAKACMRRIKEAQKEMDIETKEVIRWFHCPIVCDSTNKVQGHALKYDHYYTYLFNISKDPGSQKDLKGYEKGYQLSYVIIDSLKGSSSGKNVTPECIKQFLKDWSQSGLRNKTLQLQNISFGENTLQKDQYSCSHQVVCNFEYMMNSDTILWQIHSDKSAFKWEGNNVKYNYKKNLIRLVAFLERRDVKSPKKEPQPEEDTDTIEFFEHVPLKKIKSSD